MTTLADAVYRLIHNRAPSQATRFKRRFSQTVHSGHGRSELEVLNSYWREQLSQLPVNTIHQRECLCQSDAYDVWLKRFEDVVLPMIVEYRLPKGE